MSLLRLIVFIAIIASCHASGIGHLIPAVKFPSVVRYAPYYNFPGTVRSIHAVAPAPVLPAPPTVFPAPAPLVPAPAPLVPAPAPFLPAPAIAPTPGLPASFFAAPVPAPLLPAPALPAPAPLFTPAIPRIAPVAPTFTSSFAPVFRTNLPAVPFSPVIRPVAPVFNFAPVPSPAFTPAPINIARVPFGISPYAGHVVRPFLPPAPLAPAPIIKQFAWK